MDKHAGEWEGAVSLVRAHKMWAMTLFVQGVYGAWEEIGGIGLSSLEGQGSRATRDNNNRNQQAVSNTHWAPGAEEQSSFSHMSEHLCLQGILFLYHIIFPSREDDHKDAWITVWSKCATLKLLGASIVVRFSLFKPVRLLQSFKSGLCFLLNQVLVTQSGNFKIHVHI